MIKIDEIITVTPSVTVAPSGNEKEEIFLISRDELGSEERCSRENRA